MPCLIKKITLKHSNSKWKIFIISQFLWVRIPCTVYLHASDMIFQRVAIKLSARLQ